MTNVKEKVRLLLIVILAMELVRLKKDVVSAMVSARWFAGHALAKDENNVFLVLVKAAMNVFHALAKGELNVVGVGGKEERIVCFVMGQE